MIREVIYDEVFDAQRYYRLMLDSMARPGKINTLPAMVLTPPIGIQKATVLIAMTLLNADVSFKYIGKNGHEVTEYIRLNTSALPVDVHQADFIFINGAEPGKEIAAARIGTLAYPENSATCIIDVNVIRNYGQLGDVMIVLKGPGVEEQKIVYVAGFNENILQRLSEQNEEFPLGVDVILADRSNNIICIPRSNRFMWDIL